MTRICQWWVQNSDVDGFRWDVADRIPEDWYISVREALQAVKPQVFLLAEGWTPRQHPENDMTYDWYLHEKFKAIGTAGAPATTSDTHMSTDQANFGSITPTAYRMRYTNNHDLSNSGKASFAAYGGEAATKVFDVLCCTIGPRTKPLIYTGQECGIRTQLTGTNRVTTNPNYSTSPYRAFYARLLKFYRDHSALHPSVSMTKFSSTNNQQIYAFGRHDSATGAKVIVVSNLDGASRRADVTVPTAFRTTYKNLETGARVPVGPRYNPSLTGWGYEVLYT
jgi:glycosidase